MSRVGRSPVLVPQGVEVEIIDNTITVRGPKGSLERVIPEVISIRSDAETSTLIVERPNDERKSRALHGLTRTLVANMVVGVTEGFSKDLEIVGVGYRVQAKGANSLELALGFSHPVMVEAPEGVSFEVPVPTRITVRGIDKERVGQVAADIRKLRKPEPYKGKGVRYLNEVVRRKAGKAGK
jgi:large subunit ribosomal protein L6